MAKLPEEIAPGINAEAIAAKINDSLRQQFQKTGMPAIADAMGNYGDDIAPCQSRPFDGVGRFLASED